MRRIAVILLAVAACTPATPPTSTTPGVAATTSTTPTSVPTTPAEQAGAAWEAANIVDYTWTYRLECDCPDSGVVTVTVRAGDVVASTVDSAVGTLTVHGALARIGDVDATFDRTGYPLRARIDDIRLTTLSLSDDEALARTAQERNQTRWSNAALRTYVLTWSRSCACATSSGPFTSTVERGLVERIEADGPSPSWALTVTVDELFNIIDEEIDRHTHVVDVAYHEALGYPVSIVIDRDIRVDGDEDAYTVTSLEPLP